MDIWAVCAEAVTPAPLRGELVRMVESQAEAATHSLVDTLEEQALLEDLLETSKPSLRQGTAGLHYLLATPFRYPPLQHGSRFGQRHEPSLFYGSKGVPPALAETAYYRFVFWSGMSDPPPTGRLSTSHTLFAARYRVARGMVLHHPAFKPCAAALTDPQDYTATQALGSHMREAGVEAFEYRSARDPRRGINIALFNPQALAHAAPLWQQAWLCDARADEVSFYNKQSGAYSFAKSDFLVAGQLPTPAV